MGKNKMNTDLGFVSSRNLFWGGSIINPITRRKLKIAAILTKKINLCRKWIAYETEFDSLVELPPRRWPSLHPNIAATTLQVLISKMS